MIIRKMKEMRGGWFVGDFEPTVFKTSQFEVCYKYHTKGEAWDMHYHKKSLEINYLVRGSMHFQDVTLNAGDIFIVEPWEISNPEFLEECEVLIVKIPSSKDDKYPIQEVTK